MVLSSFKVMVCPFLILTQGTKYSLLSTVIGVYSSFNLLMSDKHILESFFIVFSGSLPLYGISS